MADSNLCILCGRKFSAKKNLNAHYRGVHKVQPRTRATIQCPKEDCRFSCNFLSNLRIHVEKEHNTVMMKEIIMFVSPEDFQDWKSTEEKKTKSSFVQHCGAKRTKDGTERITFVCHRSGKYQSSSTGKRMLKSQGSLKLGSHCTAAMELHREESGTCTVIYFRTHFGHDQHIGLLHLSRSDREAIARKIAKGVPFEKILDDVKSSIPAGEPERLHLITRHDLHNIKRDFGISDTRQQDSDGVSEQNEISDTNDSQLKRLEYKLQVLRNRVRSGMMYKETMSIVEKEVDRLLSLTQLDFRREVQHCHSSEKLKVVQTPDKPNINREVPQCHSHEKLKMARTSDKPNINRDVPQCHSNKKLKMARTSDKPNINREDPHCHSREKLKMVQTTPDKPSINREVPHCPNNEKLKMVQTPGKPSINREVPQCPNNEKLKVVQTPGKPNIEREVPHCPNNEKLKVVQTLNKPNINREVPSCLNNEKLKKVPIPIKPKPPICQSSFLLVPALIDNKNFVIVKKLPHSEVKTVPVAFDHTYCQS